MAEQPLDVFTIPGPVLRSVVQYLAARPYAEVAGLFGGINTQVRPLEPPAEPPAPPKEPSDG